MNLKIYILIFVSLLSNMLIVNVISASSLQQEESLSKEISEDVNSIRVLIKSDSIETLETHIDELEKKWFTKNKRSYRIVINTIAQILKNDSKYDLADKYTKKALDKFFALPESEKVSFEDEYYLTLHINHNISGNLYKNIGKEKEWPEIRREAAKYYFLVLERLEKSIDSEEEMKKKIGNVRYPELSEYYDGPIVRGMSPKSIKDPEIRARYQKELNEFKDVASYRSEQYGLRRIKNSEIGIIQRNVIRLYSGPEFVSKNLEVDILKVDITKYVKDEKIASIILEEIRNRLTEDLKPSPQGIDMQPGPGRKQNEIVSPGFDKENSIHIIDNGQY